MLPSRIAQGRFPDGTIRDACRSPLSPAASDTCRCSKPTMDLWCAPYTSSSDPPITSPTSTPYLKFPSHLLHRTRPRPPAQTGLPAVL